MSGITAIILSAQPVDKSIPGVVVLPHVGTLRTPADLHAARLDALARVQTPFCFFLDDDDKLPLNYSVVLDECIAQLQAGAAIAYTDEIERREGRPDYRRAALSPYSSRVHAMKPLALHHLVLMRTDLAQAVARDLPRGEFWTEHLLYWKLAQQGAVHVPSIGYVWNRKETGFHAEPRTLTAQANAMRWIALQLEGAPA